MIRDEFLGRLREAISSLPEEEIEKTLSYYTEMIGDKIEDGIPEEEVIAGLEDVQTIAQHIVGDTPLNVLVREKRKKSASGKVNTALLIMGFPLWFPLLLVGLILLLTAYILLWVGIIVLVSILVSFFGAGIGMVISFFSTVFVNGWTAVLSLGSGLTLIGLGLLLVQPIWKAVKKTFVVTMGFFKKLKYRVFKKGGQSV